MNTTKNDIIKKFNENAMDYDNQRRKLIPCFDDFYSIPVSVIELKNDTPHILDIGAGTGLFSSFIKEKYPKAKITLIDISEKMLESAKNRFKDDPNIDYIIADYTDYKFEEKYDLVISSLSIHHLNDNEKQDLYHKIFFMLKEDGIFINADQVLGHTSFIENLYKEDWKNKIEESGLTAEEINAAFDRTKLDKMATLAKQLHWLNESGFKDVDCLYKYFNFVILFGKKG
ncbi:class I SAM-dependent methyltransferase [Metabacillus fastidiosus]|uniref:class I SAM-dependent methyltransferase n=1 Tax=Metabacillus fastidiosus TaxID=1458 RepID=UPI002DB7785C|nr:class I SAM-dependent methyltransferase [Metabacillus fastidiosus]MEC2077427.1 class I SAM-dependent methyltransferase [Metabacillus fastidiosus]